jgi:hypothetical protein
MIWAPGATPFEAGSSGKHAAAMPATCGGLGFFEIVLDFGGFPLRCGRLGLFQRVDLSFLAVVLCFGGF